MVRHCGLVTAQNTPVPLKKISVRVEVKGFVADVSADLEYRNEEASPLEAVFTFPVDSDSAVYNFQATVDGKTIVAEIKEREQAQDAYDDAISSGQEAFLLEEDSSSSDIFTCRVGNLPPGCAVTVSFSLAQELPLEADGAVRFTLPAVLNPRYSPAGTQGPCITQASAPTDKPLYTLELEAHFHSPHGISRIQSNCQVTPVEFLNPDKTSAKLSLVKGHGFDRDVELLMFSENVHEPSAILEAGPRSAAPGTLMADPTVMVNLFPRFPEDLQDVPTGEFIFLMDRSGSMGMSMSHGNSRSRIQCAKDTMLLLLKSLPMGCFFNIYGFGSHFTSFFPKSVEYNQTSMQEALSQLKEIDADMGGTEILQPLSAIYTTPCVPGHPRQLFVFTDGEVSNTKQVLAEVQKNSPSHRCFSFGIGEGASTALIKGIAKAASGSYEFITGKDRMEPKVLRTLKYALQPSGTGVSLSWDLPPGVEAALLSPLPSTLFNQQKTIVYAQLKGQMDPDLECGVTLKYSLGEQPVQAETRFSLRPIECRSSSVHRLAAKALLGSLDLGSDRDTEQVKRRLVEISTQANVVCSRTAFIAINKELGQAVQGPLIRRDVPLFAANFPAHQMMRCLGAPLQRLCGAHHGLLPESCPPPPPPPAQMGIPVSGFAPQMMKFKGAHPGIAFESCPPPPSPPAQMGIPVSGFAPQMMKFKGAHPGIAFESCPPPPSPPAQMGIPVSGFAPQMMKFKGAHPGIAFGSCPPPPPPPAPMGIPVSGFADEDESLGPPAPDESPVLKLIALQNADGSWTPDPGLESLLGLSPGRVRGGLPLKDMDLTLWTTILAVIWLNAFAADSKDEWGLLVTKALSWVRARAGADLVECVKAGNRLLKTSILPGTLGL
ncbi:von Willebrand factor A domain-containing protein 5A-like isoform X8 [Hypanus sabinus]|uniref:von Willebrand factor A domain-containing protein 5A-like isoform X8 n=1 Tax=Hypanus sabinus TaxID=79690 RepID=UPI0028C3B516|nr:von Willebrand factor A domain-containing protein 5A-like isoform X8 [Hypanus sabinus]